jgi:hypothetical protein
MTHTELRVNVRDGALSLPVEARSSELRRSIV